MSNTIIAMLLHTALGTLPFAQLAENQQNLTYRQIDGSQNNPNYVGGTAPFYRPEGSAYGDGIASMGGANRPSARVVSNVIFAQNQDLFEPKGTNYFFWLWGQFIDHDMDLGKDGSEYAPVQVPTGDAWFDPFSTGTQVIPLLRDAAAPGTGVTTPREQLNTITPFIDASMVYGSDPVRQAFLRDATTGKLKTSLGNMLPYNTVGLPNAGSMDPSFYIAGDVRANENIALTSMHTVFMREHNQLVDQIASKHPKYSALKRYEEAKVIVEAEIQAITYNEFLPLLIGKNTLPPYQGFKANVNPQISNGFAASAYRLGHSLLPDDLDRMNEDGTLAQGGPIDLKDAFFNPSELSTSVTVDNMMRGLGIAPEQDLDTKAVDAVRNFLFGNPGQGGLDLISLNIQRGRDHGLLDYNAMRVAYGLPAVHSFSEITSNVVLQQQLQGLYGNVNNIDVYVGGLAEDHVAGAMVGPLLQRVLVDQFKRLRDGDKFWYERRLTSAQVAMIKNTHLSDIILRNTNVDYLQPESFIAYERIAIPDQTGRLIGGNSNNLFIGTGGEMMIGSNARNVYAFGPNCGSNQILNFHNHDYPTWMRDTIDLRAFHTSYRQLKVQYQGNKATFSINNHDKIIMNKSDARNLQISDFVF